MLHALQAVASPRRREILRLVWDRERPAGEIAAEMPEVSFGAVSQHLKILEEAGLVRRRQAGRFRLYAADQGSLGPLASALEAMWADGLTRLKAKAEMEVARRGPRRRAQRRRGR
jgi:DNA-binding transcriptional ArsR family regulator